MAFITPVSPTAQPVFALDVRNGSISGSANVAAQGPVQPQGPKLDFFSLTANASLATSAAANGYLGNVLQAIQSGGGTTGTGTGCTIAMYQIGPDPAVINLAIYPTGAYTTATLVAAAQTANAAIGIPTANVAGSATFTNV